MFKLGRWNDKNKFKSVFKLQFHVTQVTEINGETLTISVIPADVGKSTVRLEKVTVRDGSCQWSKPIYETIKFIKDSKTGKIHPKMYNFVVASGSSKSGVIGEVLLDLANYAAVAKISDVSLPFKNAKSQAVLHVSIQRMVDSTDQSDLEEIENSKCLRQDRSLRVQFGNCDSDSTTKLDSSQELQFNVKRRDSCVSDVTLSSPESTCILDSPPQLGTQINEDEKPTDSDLLKVNSHWEWLNGSAPELSSDGSSSSQQESHAELAALARQADVLELELQTLRKQVVKESRKGDGFLKEIVCLKDENERLRSSIRKKPRSDGGDPWILIEELREEVGYEKDLNANLWLRLQKTQDSNSELILAVQDLEEMLEKKMQLDCSNKPTKCQDEEQGNFKEEHDKDRKPVVESYLLEQIEIHKKEKEELEMQVEQLALDYEILKQECHGIACKLTQKELMDQLKIRCETSDSNEDSNELDERMKTLEKQVKNLEEELDNQEHKFELDLEELARKKIECEKRAIKAEETLRRVREQNSKTAERLQEEFKNLSSQMASTFESNEKVAVRAMNEANSLRIEKNSLQEMLKKAKEDIDSVRVFYEAKLAETNEKVNLKRTIIDKIEVDIKETQRVHKDEIERLKKLENEKLVKKLEEKDSEIGYLESELKNLEGQCNDLKRSMMENENESKKQRNQVTELKSDLKKKEEAIINIEKKLKNKVLEGTKANLKNNKSNAANSKERIKLLEGQIKLKENAFEISTNSFIAKEKDLNRKIGELEKRLEVISRNDFEKVSKESSKLSEELANLKEKNELLEEELKEMEERYSGVSLKFAEVEGERQQLVMTLRNLKSLKKM